MLQELQHNSFINNRGKVVGRGPTSVQRQLAEKQAEERFIESAVDVLESGNIEDEILHMGDNEDVDATVAGFPVTLVLITFVTSRCVLLVQSPISGPEGCRPRVPRTVKVIGTSGAYPQSAKRRTTGVQLYTACSLFMYMS